MRLWVSHPSFGKMGSGSPGHMQFHVRAWQAAATPEVFPLVWSHCSLHSFNYFILFPSPLSSLLSVLVFLLCPYSCKFLTSLSSLSLHLSWCPQASHCLSESQCVHLLNGGNGRWMMSSVWGLGPSSHLMGGSSSLQGLSSPHPSSQMARRGGLCPQLYRV